MVLNRDGISISRELCNGFFVKSKTHVRFFQLKIQCAVYASCVCPSLAVYTLLGALYGIVKLFGYVILRQQERDSKRVSPDIKYVHRVVEE